MPKNERESYSLNISSLEFSPTHPKRVKKSNLETVYFFKRNDKSDFKTKLEVMSSDIQRLLSDQKEAKNHTVVNDQDNTTEGLVSEEIPNYLPILHFRETEFNKDLLIQDINNILRLLSSPQLRRQALAVLNAQLIIKDPDYNSNNYSISSEGYLKKIDSGWGASDLILDENDHPIKAIKSVFKNYRQNSKEFTIESLYSTIQPVLQKHLYTYIQSLPLYWPNKQLLYFIMNTQLNRSDFIEKFINIIANKFENDDFKERILNHLFAYIQMLVSTAKTKDNAWIRILLLVHTSLKLSANKSGDSSKLSASKVIQNSLLYLNQISQSRFNADLEIAKSDSSIHWLSNLSANLFHELIVSNSYIFPYILSKETVTIFIENLNFINYPQLSRDILSTIQYNKIFQSAYKIHNTLNDNHTTRYAMFGQYFVEKHLLRDNSTNQNIIQDAFNEDILFFILLPQDIFEFAAIRAGFSDLEEQSKAIYFYTQRQQILISKLSASNHSIHDRLNNSEQLKTYFLKRISAFVKNNPEYAHLSLVKNFSVNFDSFIRNQDAVKINFN